MSVFEGKFHIELGEPHVVVQGAPGDQFWGHYNFPSFSYTKSGALIASWAYGEDKVGGVHHEGGVRPPYVSYDGGKTWGPNEKGEESAPRFVMPDGKYFLGFCGKKQVPVEYARDKEPAVRFGNRKMYFAEDFGKTEDTVVKARIYDPETDTVETYEPTVNWPYAPLVFWPNEIAYPVTQIFSLNNCGLMQKDGVLYLCLYMFGFDSTAKSREEAILPYTKYSVYVFSSEDCARTWNFLSQIPVTAETWDDKPGFEGFCEPMMDVMPDGSFVMLIRTGSFHKSYIVRSADKCRTWTKPAVFDECGVLPQILSLPCGVTLAAYGRPDMRVRATSDPAGLKWEDPILVDLYGMKVEDAFYRSCFYTHFLPVDDNTALWIYTDFQYPNPDGEGVKTVLVREIKVVKD